MNKIGFNKIGFVVFVVIGIVCIVESIILASGSTVYITPDESYGNISAIQVIDYAGAVHVASFCVAGSVSLLSAAMCLLVQHE